MKPLPVRLLTAALMLGQVGAGVLHDSTMVAIPSATEHQITHGAGGRILTNIGVWSPDGEWIVYDTRSDAAGQVFDGTRIEMVHVRTGEIRLLYESRRGACCGVATFHPSRDQVVFILGPEDPTPDWQYCAWHRQGVVVDAPTAARPSLSPPRLLDARDLTPPFTPGALRGGSHVHVWDARGEWVSFTYEDHVLATAKDAPPGHDLNQRNVGVCMPGRVQVPRTHARNHDGDFFSALVTRTTAQPRAGSDEISRACEEGWIGTNGYVRADGSRQKRALAFQGQVVSLSGRTVSEVYVVDLPDTLAQPGEGPLAGTETRLPSPPRGASQRRLTFTTDRAYPGIQGPRHWLRSSPDGSRIAFLAKDAAGIVQLWTISPNGGEPAQLTRNEWSVASAFTWHPEGRWLAHLMDDSVCLTDARTGTTHRLTPKGSPSASPRPEACVFSPDGNRIAYVRRLTTNSTSANQIFVLQLQLPATAQP